VNAGASYGAAGGRGGHRQDDLFRSSLEAIINLRHPLVRLAAEINWDFLANKQGGWE
jgi:hypothetical protein